MHTDPRRQRPLTGVVVAFVTLVVALLATGCAAGSGVSAPPAASRPPTTAPSASAVPSADPDGSVGVGVPPAGSPGAPDPGGRIVVPRPGQLNVRAIAAELLSATVEGRRVIVGITFTSGVEPCYVLDSIVVQRGDHAFAMTLREGSAPPGDTVCIEIAETKRTIVDLGELEPGTYTISDTQGGAQPIDVTVT